MDNAYVYSMREHLAGIKVELEGLTEITKKRSLSQYEYRAAERTLQILIEACIGIAKQWSYAISKTAPADAYGAFERLSQQGIESVEKVQWREIIGMRNALVHDYLNIEAEIIKTVIKNAIYQQLNEFTSSGLDALDILYQSTNH
ncbi:MAG: hypothetical protein ACI8WB_004201 [Phenylobacterium sp.]|jgi:uncharacterized protein YutE (UPF0331/DUF86 family)